MSANFHRDDSGVVGGTRRRGGPWSFWLLAGVLCALTAGPAILAIQRVDRSTAEAEAAPAGVAAVPAHAPSGGHGPAAPEGAAGITQGASPVAPVVNSDQPDAGDLPDGWTTTRFGPLSPADRDLLVRVRQAGLWEAPAGTMAQQRSTNPKIKEVGNHLATEHARLDAQVRSVATQLNVDLPNEPNADQQSWLKEMSSRTGAPFDQVFTERLRAAHGKVFAVLAAVRAGTRNDLVRSFAQVGIDVVMRHMTLLEGTGLVAYQDLPTPPPPTAQAQASFSTGSPSELIVVWVIVAAAALVGARALWNSRS